MSHENLVGDLILIALSRCQFLDFAITSAILRCPVGMQLIAEAAILEDKDPIREYLDSHNVSTWLYTEPSFDVDFTLFLITLLTARAIRDSRDFRVNVADVSTMLVATFNRNYILDLYGDSLDKDDIAFGIFSMVGTSDQGLQFKRELDVTIDTAVMECAELRPVSHSLD